MLKNAEKDWKMWTVKNTGITEFCKSWNIKRPRNRDQDWWNMSEEENKENPRSVFNANILGSYKQATLQ